MAIAEATHMILLPRNNIIIILRKFLMKIKIVMNNYIITIITIIMQVFAMGLRPIP